MTSEDLKRKIIIALDVKNKEEAVDTVSKLVDARIFKVGLELFTAEGPALFKKLKVLRKSVFLDLKFHDIPNTVAGAVRSAVRHGVQMMTIHTSGGREMMARAVEAARETSESEKIEKPILLGVTILTSMKSAELEEVGMKTDVAAQVLRLAGLAKSAGMDGIVCSPQEIEIVRKEYGRSLLLVTPGIRPAWAAAQDQKRIMTPAEAVEKGADYLVIGRPITGDPSPAGAFLRILDELERAVNPADRENRA
jgi:orotidine-5'-phosphate decarboxylase